MLNNFLFGGKKKKSNPRNKTKTNKKNPLNQTTSFEKNATQTRKSNEPKNNSNKKKHQRNFIERFCHKPIMFCGTKEVSAIL